jgi:hypothetical protein
MCVFVVRKMFEFSWSGKIIFGCGVCGDGENWCGMYRMLKCVCGKIKVWKELVVVIVVDVMVKLNLI